MPETETAVNSSSSTFALTSGWLSQAQTVNTQNALTSGSVTFGDTFGIGTWYPSWSYPVYVSSPSRPIKLTLSEIEKLRKLARADKAVQEILAKFTDQIEITVDFK